MHGKRVKAAYNILCCEGSVDQFKEYMSKSNEDKCLDFEEKRRVTDSEIRTHFAKLGVSNITRQ